MTGFETDGLIGRLEGMSSDDLDRLAFGVIGFGQDRKVSRYNATESRAAGLSPERVVGRDVFEEVAPCMNNFMVAQRFDDEPTLDATIDYVLTLRMRPTKVRLRLMQAPGVAHGYIAVERR